jgi:hypothetical protein
VLVAGHGSSFAVRYDEPPGRPRPRLREQRQSYFPTVIPFATALHISRRAFDISRVETMPQPTPNGVRVPPPASPAPVLRPCVPQAPVPGRPERAASRTRRSRTSSPPTADCPAELGPLVSREECPFGCD